MRGHGRDAIAPGPWFLWLRGESIMEGEFAAFHLRVRGRRFRGGSGAGFGSRRIWISGQASLMGDEVGFAIRAAQWRRPLQAQGFRDGPGFEGAWGPPGRTWGTMALAPSAAADFIDSFLLGPQGSPLARWEVGGESMWTRKFRCTHCGMVIEVDGKPPAKRFPGACPENWQGEHMWIEA